MAAVLTVVFWTVMSGLLLRDVYFPEASRFAVVPPRVVIDLFLRQSDAFGSALHLHHQGQKIGHANFQISRRATPGQETLYDVLARGVVEEVVSAEKGVHRVAATWNIAFSLADAERWDHLAVGVDLPPQHAGLKLSWSQGQAAPEVLVTQSGRVVMNSQDVQTLMKLGAGKEGAASMLAMLGGGLPKNGQSSASLQFQAREGVMTLARRERKCFVLTLPLIGDHAVKMVFTEGGELARIELPDDYTLLEPTIHGLQN